MVKSHARGHEIVWDGRSGKWVYADDRSSADVERPCVRCHRLAPPEGYDPCLGYIPGAIGACCGHGRGPGYVIYP